MDVARIKHELNTEVVRRLLIKYFIDKGFVKSFDMYISPALLQDLPMMIPILRDKIEIVPNLKELDIINGKATLAWNMFILGSHRMYLGETFHNDLKELAVQISSGQIQADASCAKRLTTPRRFIAFCTKVLGTHDSGYIDLRPTQNAAQPASFGPASMGQTFYSRPY